MSTDESLKVTPSHLRRDAYLYVRQSTLRQVFENTESTQRQYALRERAVALGWPQDRIVVIDNDLGQSGATAVDREGFQRLVTEVSMGRVGIVLGLEVSRLARNSADWHRLLEICALTDTLILDEDGVYDPSHFNDRMLLGLKGTMSEAELHVLKARLRGGILNKARRGELPGPLPVGFAYDARQRVVLDPDVQVQQSVHLLFDTFLRTGSAWKVVQTFAAQGLAFPRHVRSGPRSGELIWRPLEHYLVLHVLHNPRYAGAFAFGRHRARKLPNGRATFETVARPEWIALVKDAHPGYITWEQYEAIEAQLRECSQAHAAERAKSPPREGPALLQGLVLCRRCGQRMTVRYNVHRDVLTPRYVCSHETVKHGLPACQDIPGHHVDEAVGELVLASVTPRAIASALAVQEELRRRGEQARRLREQQVERCRYEAELARRRFVRVDPDNRLVAASLEAEWNEKLRAVQDAQEECERRSKEDEVALTAELRAAITELATDLPRVWRDPKTSARERKRLVRLVVEDVSLLKTDDGIEAGVRLRGGTVHELHLPRPKSAPELRKTSPEVIATIDRLLDEYTERSIANVLNERGLRSGEKKRFTPWMIWRLRTDYHLVTRYDRLRARGLLTLDEVAAKLHVAPNTIKMWRRAGLLHAHPYNDKNEYLYETPGEDAPVKHKWKLHPRATAAQTTHAPSG